MKVEPGGAGAVSQTHPDYDEMLPDWELVRDSIKGETTVKDQTETYLPKPSGFRAQTDGGDAMYTSYILRAKFPEIMGPSIRGMVGIIHRVPAEITLPAELEPLRESCTPDKQTLASLHERITYEILATGRYGLLVDAPEDGQADLPYIVGYKAETIINWDRITGNFYVLDESYLEREGFTWIDTYQYRVLELAPEPEVDEEGNLITPEDAPLTFDPGTYIQTLWSSDEGGSTVAYDPIQPQMRGGAKFDEIPFVVIGSTDVGPDVDEIPLIGVSRAAFNMYRLDADYKWQLFMSGQETLFVFSDSESPVSIVGAGVVINLPSTSKAEYVGPKGIGIASHKEAILDERQQAIIAGSRIFDTEKKSQESGDALKIRYAAQTASLTTIAINSAKGLERALKYCARFIGADEDAVSVRANLSFMDTELDPIKAQALMQLWMGGAISKETLYADLQKGGLASFDRNFAEEEEKINQEIPDLQTPALTVEDQKLQQTQAHEQALTDTKVKAQLAKPKLVAKK